MPRVDDDLGANLSSNAVDITIHNVQIVDSSGSMEGRKYDNAIKGVNLDQKKLQELSQKCTQTVIEFDTMGANMSLKEHYFMVPIANCSPIKGRGARGGTPLYQCVGETLESLEEAVPREDKCLVTIFTDGEENQSHGKYRDPKVLKVLIDRLQETRNFTITFMGTKFEVDKMVREMNLFATNTLVHDNTAESIKMSYGTRTASAVMYSKGVQDGKSQEELKQNFFVKGVVEEDDKI